LGRIGIIRLVPEPEPIEMGNLIACQYHPQTDLTEKGGRLENFNKGLKAKNIIKSDAQTFRRHFQRNQVLSYT